MAYKIEAWRALGLGFVLHYSVFSEDYRQAWPTIIAAFIFLAMRNEIKVVSIIKVYDVSLFVWPLALTVAFLEGPQCTHAFARSVGHINQRTCNLSVKQTAAHLCWFIILGSEEFRITKRKPGEIQTKALQANMVLGTYTILRILMKIIGIWKKTLMVMWRGLCNYGSVTYRCKGNQFFQNLCLLHFTQHIFNNL